MSFFCCAQWYRFLVSSRGAGVGVVGLDGMLFIRVVALKDGRLKRNERGGVCIVTWPSVDKQTANRVMAG